MPNRFIMNLYPFITQISHITVDDTGLWSLARLWRSALPLGRLRLCLAGAVYVPQPLPLRRSLLLAICNETFKRPSSLRSSHKNPLVAPLLPLPSLRSPKSPDTIGLWSLARLWRSALPLGRLRLCLAGAVYVPQPLPLRRSLLLAICNENYSLS
jgi:hypothetical protein